MDRVAERNLGAFAGWPTMNDSVRPRRPWHLMPHCCTGNAARTLYQAWGADPSSTGTVGSTFICWAALNRLASRGPTWHSHLPYRGQGGMRGRRRTSKSYRCVSQHGADARRRWKQPAGHARRQRSMERAVRQARSSASGARPPTARFPILERSRARPSPEARKYDLVLRGNDVVRIDDRSGCQLPRSTSVTTTAQTRRGGGEHRTFRECREGELG